MDKKAIEEVAKQRLTNGPYKRCAPYYEEGMIDMFKAAVEYVMSLPLSERLTEEEKEKARKYYQYLSECIFNKTADVEYLKGKRTMLVLIFGKEMFKEDK